MTSPKPRLRVLHVVDTLGMGGVETWLMELLKFWRGQDDAPQIDILATSGEPGLFDDEARALGAQVFYAHFGRSSLPQFVRSFRKILRQGRYDAIHDHQGYISGWHFLLGAGLLPPVRIAHLHNATSELRSRTPARRLIARVGKSLIGRRASYIAGTSRQLITEYGFDEGRFAGVPKGAVYCGIDTRRFTGDPEVQKRSVCKEFGWPDDSRIVLFAGRIDPSADPKGRRSGKNSALAVAVAIEAARRDGRVRMLLAGALSAAVPELERRIAEAGLQGQIRFAGVRRDIGRLMLASDVLLFPSEAEGLGMVAVEAQAAGLPVLASAAVPRECVVIPQLVEFCSMSAPVEAWADRLLQAATRRRDVAAANRQVLSSPFGVQSSARAVERLYSRPRRVLHVVDTLGMGGVETWLMELLKLWRGQDDAPQIDILATSGEPGLFDDEARALGAQVFYSRFGRTSLPQFACSFRKILRQGRYDAIHDHQGYISGWHFLLGAGLLPPVRIAHLHNPLIELRSRTPARRLIARVGKSLVGRRASYIAGTSRQLITEYGFDEGRFAGVPKGAVYCGIDTRRFTGDPEVQKRSVCKEFGWPAGSRIVLFAGRIDPSAEIGGERNHKNSALAVAVAIEAARRDGRVRMLLAGARSAAVPELERRIAEAGLQGQIRFAGVRRDIGRLMLASDVLLFPSEAEGLGMVAVEAQAAGLLVLASAAVPRECVVIPRLYRALDLHEPIEAWAGALLERLAAPRMDPRISSQAVQKSPFSIVGSAERLTRIYGDSSA